MNKETIKTLAVEAISENEQLFLVRLDFQEDNHVQVIVDGDQGIPLKECMRISRHIEHSFEENEMDFSLVVTSPDISESITHQRQYNKNIGRTVTVKIKEPQDVIEGELIEVTDDSITLTWKAREPKPIGKGKVTVTKEQVIPFNNVQQANVKIIF